MTSNLQAWVGAAARPRGGATRSAAYRAEYYREKAQRLRQMAGWEAPGKMRERLSELARSYEQLAAAFDGAATTDG
jgi:hypothetical protein